MLLGLRERVRRVLPPQPPLSSAIRWGLAGVVAVGALTRVVWAISTAQRPKGLADPGLYLLLSETLADGDGYRYLVLEPGATAYYPPGFPMTLAGVQWLSRLLPGDLSPFGVAIGLNVVLSVLTIVLLFELGRRLVDAKVGLVAAGAFALWPNIVVHSGVVLTETLFLLLFVLMLLVALATPAVAQSPGWARLITVGLLFGAVGMVRPTSFVVAPVFLLLWWRQGVAVVLERCAVVAAMVLVLVVPWTIRNYQAMDALVLVSTNTGDNLCIGHNPETTGGYQVRDYCDLGQEGKPTGPRPEIEVRRQSDNVNYAWEYIKDHPLSVLTRMPAKLRYTLEEDTDGLYAAADYGNRDLWNLDRYRQAEALSDVYYYLAAAAGVAGLVMLARRADPARRRLFMVTMCLGQLAAPALTFGDLRFKFPIYPALALGAGVCVMAIVRRRLPDSDADPAEAAEPSTPPSTTDATPAEALAGAH